MNAPASLRHVRRSAGIFVCAAIVLSACGGSSASVLFDPSDGGATDGGATDGAATDAGSTHDGAGHGGGGADAAEAPGDCTPQSCQPSWSGAPSQACINDGCSGAACTEAEPGGVCPDGYTFSSFASCNPAGPPPNGICQRGCTSPQTTHHCIELPADCSPASCSSCLPANVCNGAPCATITNGIMQCQPAA